MVVCGHVYAASNDRFHWDIDDFISVISNHGVLLSPPFTFSDASCRLRIDFRRNSNLKLCFSMNSSHMLRKLKVELGMETGYEGQMETRAGDAINGGCFLVRGWMTCSEMLERRCEILRNGCLTIFCTLRILEIEEDEYEQEDIPDEEAVAGEEKNCESDSNDDEATLNRKTQRKLRKDLKSLLDSREDCDVTIKVQGKEFRAHSILLRARSPVFKSMFTHETLEKQSGVVDIEDCDPVTFPDFLNYLYTGSTNHICDANVCQLYTDADKYGVKELKEECAAFMESNLSVDKFCDFITLAVRHDERDLVDSATEFFCVNAQGITKTVKWQTFLHENTTLGNELIIKLIANVKQPES